MDNKKANFLKQLKKTPYLSGFLAFFISLTIIGFIANHNIQSRIGDEKDKALMAALKAKQNLQSSLSHSLAATKTLSYIYLTHGINNNFAEIGRAILASNPNIDAVQLVSKQGVITHVFPVSGNEAVIGYNVMEDETRNTEAYKALERRELFFAGPFPLRQGGIGVVGRLPMFKNDEFQGFSAVVIKLETLLESADFKSIEFDGYQLILSKFNDDTKQLEVYFGDTLKLKNLFNVEVEVPLGGWKISVGRYNNAMIFKETIPFIILGLLVSVLIGILVYYLTKRPQELIKQVSIRTVELEKSKKLYQAVLKANPDLILILNQKGEFIDFNQPRNIKLYSEPQVFLGKHYSSILPEENSRLFTQIFSEVLQNGVTQSFNYCLVHADGDKRYYESRLVLLPDQNLMQLIQDVTPNVLNKEKLKHSEEQYRNILETVNEGVWVTNHQGITTFVNEFIVNLLGYKKEEIIGQHYLQFVEPSYHHLIQDYLLNKVLTNARHEFTLLAKNGKKIQTLTAITKVTEDNKPAGFMALITNLTEIKNALNALAETELAVKAFFDSSTHGFVLFNKNQKIKTFNSVADYFFKNFLGHALIKESTLNKALLEANSKTFLKLFIDATNGNYASQTVSFIHTTGNEIWVNVNFNKVTDSVNHVLGFSLSLFDITEIKEAENKILAQNEVLKKIAWTQSHIVRKPLANILAISELVKMEMVAQGFTTETIDSLMNSTKLLDESVHEVVQFAVNYQAPK